MKVSILTPNKDGKAYTLCLKDPTWANQLVEISLCFCKNPLCRCHAITFKCKVFDAVSVESSASLNEKTHLLEFVVDLEERCLARSASSSEEGAPPCSLAEAVCAELLDSDWDELDDLFREGKHTQLHSTATELLDVQLAHFPPDLASNPQLMVYYDEILPFEDLLTFRVEDRDWLADLQYCVNPHCQCEEATFCFVPLKDLTKGGRVPESELLSPVTYSYVDGSVGSNPEFPVPTEQHKLLLLALRKSMPGLNAELRARHERLRTLYRTALAKERQKRQMLSRPPGAVGRNERCPCGSGRKYRKCCGMT